MTVTEILTYVRRLHNEENAQTPNWSDQELYALITNKANEMLGTIGMIEGKTTTSTVIAQADYDYPENFIRIRRLWYAGQALKYLSFRQFEARQVTGTAPSGTPREFMLWNNVITLIPTPSAVATLTIFGEKMQGSITDAATVLRIPSVFHPAICDAVISEMYMKDENIQFAKMYQDKWLQVHIPAMKEFAKRRRRRGLPSVVTDADSVMETEFGII